MTISRANGGGWAASDKLTSTQANTMDTNATYALDKRSGQTDTLQSVVTASGSGRIINSYFTAPNVSTTIALSSGISFINASADTASRTYQLSNAGASAGDRVTVLGVSNPAFTTTIQNAAATTLIVLGVLTNSAFSTMSITGGGTSAWAEFIYNGSAWILLESDVAHPNNFAFSHWPRFWNDTATTTGSSVVTNNAFKMLTDTDMRFNPLGCQFRTVWTSTSAAYYYVMPLTSANLRQSKTLTGVAVTIKPSAGHGGLPQQMPAISVIRNTIKTYSGSPTLLLSTGNGWSVDSSGSVVNYELEHDITFTPNQNNVIDHSTYVYSIVFMNEGGANALANGTTSGVQLVQT